jgi:hypothetical protein
MGLLFRRRRPLMRLAGAAAIGGVAYNAGKSRGQQATSDQQVSEGDAAGQGAPAAVAAPAAPAAVAEPPAVPTDELERLATLHQSGALTDDEFSAAKSKLLGV